MVGTLDEVVPSREGVKADDDEGGFFSGVQGVMITAGSGWRGCKLEIWYVPPSTRAFQSSTAVRDGRRKTGGVTMRFRVSPVLRRCRCFGLAVRLGLRMNCSFCVRHKPVKPFFK